MHTMPTSFLPPVVDHTEFPKDCFLNAHYSPALLERGKGKLNCIAKTAAPVVPFGVVVGLPHSRARSPSQALLRDIGHPTLVRRVPPLQCPVSSHPFPPYLPATQPTAPPLCPFQVSNGGNFSLEWMFTAYLKPLKIKIHHKLTDPYI